MERSSATRFDFDAVGRPLSERGHVQTGPSREAPAGPAEQIEQSKERLARDVSQAKAKLAAVSGDVKSRARSVGVAAALLLTAALAAAATVRASRRRHRRGFWRAVARAW